MRMSVSDAVKSGKAIILRRNCPHCLLEHQFVVPTEEEALKPRYVFLCPYKHKEVEVQVFAQLMPDGSWLYS